MAKYNVKKVLKKVTNFEGDGRIIHGNMTDISYNLGETDGTTLVMVRDKIEIDLESELTVKPKSKYKFHRSIGRGGMKQIIEAIDTDTSRHIAVAELIDTSKQEMHARFIREAKITANLEHPNIVPIHDIGVNEDGVPYFTMKFLKGETLASILSKLKAGDPEYVDKWTLTRLLMAFRKICNATGFAHTKNVVHLDLTPENVQVGRFGEVLVLDWGLANILNDDGSVSDDLTSTEYDIGDYRTDITTLTLDGDIKGTPGYMAPEQAAGKNNERDQRTDIYALGAILYAILTYEPPVRVSHVEKMLEDTIEGRINPIRKTLVRHHIPSSLVAVTLRAMRVDPSRRYQSVREMRSEIDSFISGFSTKAENASLLTETLLMIKRHRLVSIMAVIIFFMLIFFGSKLQEEKRLQRGGWKQVYREDYTSVNTDLSFLSFKDQFNYQIVPDWKADSKGVYSPTGNSWMWLENVNISGDVRVELKVKTEGPSDAIQIALNSLNNKVSRRWDKPQGYTFQFGGFNSTQNVLYKGNVILKTDMTQASLPPLDDDQYHTLAFTREGSELMFSVDDQEKIRVSDMFASTGKNYNRIGVRSFSNKIKIASVSVKRLTLPEKASPLIAGDVLVENSHFKDAVDKYMTIAENFESSIVGEKALAKAYITAATMMQGDQSDLLDEIKFFIDCNFPKFTYTEEILEVDALLAWKKVDYEKTFSTIDKLFKLNSNSMIMQKITEMGHFHLPPEVGPEFLKRIARSNNTTHLNISNFMLNDLTPIKGMNLTMLDCSLNNLTGLSPLKGMHLKRLDCSSNKITSLDFIKDVTVQELDCSFNLIKEVQPLKNSSLRSINLNGNNIEDIHYLLEAGSLEKVIIPVETKDIEVLKDSKSIKYLSDSKHDLELDESRFLFWQKIENSGI